MAPARLEQKKDAEPVMLSFRCSKFFIILTISLSIYTDIFLYAVIVPVIPFALRERVHVPDDEVQYWVSILLAVYGAALLAASPLCGWLSDRITMRRFPYLFGLFTLAAATAMLTVGNSIALLVVGRVLQGMSAAIVWTVGLAIVVDTVGKQNEIGVAFGYISMAMSLGLLTGPLFGGIVFNKAGYLPVFGMCFGLLGIDIICRLFMIERKVAKKWIPILDSRSPSIAALSDRSRPTTRDDDGTKRESRDCSTSTTLCDRRILTLSELDVQLNDLAARRPYQSSTTGIERTTSHLSRYAPSIPASATEDLPPRTGWKRLPPILTLLAYPRFLAALYAALIQAILFTAFDSTLPIRVRNIFGWDSLGAGLIFLPLVVPTFLAPLFGMLSDRYGPRWFCVVSFLATCPFLVLLRLVYYDTLGQKVILSTLLAFAGLSIAIAFPAIMAEVTYSIEHKERHAPEGTYGKNGAYAQGYALFNVAYATGCLVGPIWGGMVKEAAGWNTMCWSLGLLSAVSALPCALYIGGWIGRAEKWVKRSADV